MAHVFTKMIGFHLSSFLSQHILEVNSVLLTYRRHTDSVPLFYEKLRTFNTAEEVDIILWDFDLNTLDPRVFPYF